MFEMQGYIYMCTLIFKWLYKFMKTQLLCTFSDIKNYRNVIPKIDSFYNIVFNKVYVLQNKDSVDELLITYNIDADKNSSNSFFPNTISVHRKKDTNTIYTINSLNELIKKLNKGVMDTKYPIKPAVGKFVMFPSWLQHMVYPFRGEGLRRSMSFNWVFQQPNT